jgi:diguanylate cyclase (GGDEF)-like protein
MERYQKKFIERMKETIAKWKNEQTVSHTAVIRFFHTIVGTGATIGLHEYAEAAKDQLEKVKNMEKEEGWTFEEVAPMLINFPFHQEIEKEAKQETMIHDSDEFKPLILLIDADHDFVEFTKRMLEQEGFMVLAALTAEKGLQLYMNQRPDCVLLDYEIPGVKSFHLLEQLLKKAKNEYIPVMMISAEVSPTVELEAYRKGVTDYFVKPIQQEEFLVRLKNRLHTRRSVQNSVMIDELTGAFSRRFLEIEAKRLIETYHRYGEHFSVAILDLDHFKQVNDNYGHSVGDQVLIDFVHYLNQAKRKLDLVFRLGGEEFLMLFPHTQIDQALLTLNRFLEGFQAKVFKGGNSNFQITFSAGLTEMKGNLQNIQPLLEESDQALYEAKGNGRNQVAVYHSTSIKKVHSQVHIYVVDDDPIIRQVLSDHIGSLNIKGVTIHTESFREGESFLSSDWYKPRERHIIILDRIMPRMDGLELVAEIRGEYPQAKVVIMMLTGRNNEKEIVRALDLGADDYVTKPFKLDELLARVKRLIYRSFI